MVAEMEIPCHEEYKDESMYEDDEEGLPMWRVLVDLCMVFGGHCGRSLRYM